MRPLTLLKSHREFRLVFIGQYLSAIGSMISAVALPYQIYQLTHSTIWVGLLSLVQLFPILFTALIGGVLADKNERKPLIVTAEMLMVIGLLGLAANTHVWTLQIPALFVLAFTTSGLTGLHRPALEGLMQQIVPRDCFMAYGAMRTFTYSSCMIGAPAVAAWLILHTGLMSTYLLDAASFILSIGTLLMIKRYPKPDRSEDEPPFKFLMVGLRYAMTNEPLFASYLVDFFAMVLAMPQALYPAIADHYHQTMILGYLYSAPAIGALLISLFGNFFNSCTTYGRGIAISAGSWGLSMCLFAITLNTHIYFSLVFLALAGAFDAGSGIFRMTLWNEVIPTKLRGRLAGIEMISYMSGPKLGDTVAGFTAHLLGFSLAIGLGGLGCMTVVFVCCLKFKKFWQYRRVSRV